MRTAPDSAGSEEPNEVEVLLARLSRIADERDAAQDEVRTPKEANSALRREKDELRSDEDTRDKLNDLIPSSAQAAWGFLYLYCIVAFSIVLSDALTPEGRFDIDRVVLSVLVGSTAVTVVGLVAIVLSGVFRTRERK